MAMAVYMCIYIYVYTHICVYMCVIPEAVLWQSQAMECLKELDDVEYHSLFVKHIIETALERKDKAHHPVPCLGPRHHTYVELL